MTLTSRGPDQPLVTGHTHAQGDTMIVLGCVLLIIGWFLGIGIVLDIGVLLIIIGCVLLALGAARTGGRRYY
jgi:1,4-dihydroxy-2-naphthoate octaprenyltransferase